MYVCASSVLLFQKKKQNLHFCPYIGTRKAQVLNSLIMKITVNENDINDILQTLR